MVHWGRSARMVQAPHLQSILRDGLTRHIDLDPWLSWPLNAPAISKRWIIVLEITMNGLSSGARLASQGSRLKARVYRAFSRDHTGDRAPSRHERSDRAPRCRERRLAGRLNPTFGASWRARQRACAGFCRPCCAWARSLAMSTGQNSPRWCWG